MSILSRRNEELKRMKSKIRAMEMLKNSKMPKNLELQHKMNKLKRMNSMSRSHDALHRLDNRRASLDRSHEIPNYDKLYRKFMTEFEFRKAQNKKNTEIKPFVLRSASRARNRQNRDNKADRKVTRSKSLMSLSNTFFKVTLHL